MTRLIALFPLLLLTLGCGGHGAGTTPTVSLPQGDAPDAHGPTSTGIPRIESVAPTGPIGVSGSTVLVIARATNQPTAWHWTFTGATPATSGDMRPTITLGSMGSFSGSVVASNSHGASVAYEFGFRTTQDAQPPVVYLVTPDGTVGNSGDKVTFHASANHESRTTCSALD